MASRIREYTSFIGDSETTAADVNEECGLVVCHEIERLTDEERSAFLGMGKVIESFALAEKAGSCTVESDSVYGAAIVLPQIARSCRWPISLIVLTFRTYLFLMLNYVVQFGAIYYVYDEQTNANAFAGTMHLCDFAAGIQHCPGGKNCQGPGGTDYDNPGRLYSYDIWSTRGFVRDSLKMVFPEKADEVQKKIDPGEYGLESYWCRLLCVFIFIIQIADDLQGIFAMVKLFWRLPTNSKSWVSYAPPDWGTKEYAKKVHDLEELDLVTFEIQGMPVAWKVINVIFVLIPRSILWLRLSHGGVYFLMETPNMMDEIVNTTALSFILSIDELIVQRLTSPLAKHILGNIQEYKFYDPSVHDKVADDDVVENFISHELGGGNLQRLRRIIPHQLIMKLVLMFIFLWEHYHLNCKVGPDGSWVSKDRYLPKTAHMNPWCLLYCDSSHEGSPFWTMPSNQQET